MKLAESLMDALGFTWVAARGKTWNPDEGEPYYHITSGDGIHRTLHRFRTMPDLLAFLRAERAEQGNPRSRAGRKPSPAANRILRTVRLSQDADRAVIARQQAQGITYTTALEALVLR